MNLLENRDWTMNARTNVRIIFTSNRSLSDAQRWFACVPWAPYITPAREGKFVEGRSNLKRISVKEQINRLFINLIKAYCIFLA